MSEYSQIGGWAKLKHNRLKVYLELATSAVREKWTNMVYIDLFAGCGKNEDRNTGEITDGSPIIALSNKIEFSQYIFCEKSNTNLNLLRSEVEQSFAGRNISYFHGDANDQIDSISELIPTGRTLTICFIDPYGLHIHFETIRKLSQSHRVDFIMLLASHMDLVRNRELYAAVDNHVIDRFLGDDLWRTNFDIGNGDLARIIPFVVGEFSARIQKLDYKPPKAAVIRNNRGVNLYHLLYFSRHQLGEKLWKVANKYSGDTIPLFDD